ncbi:MAG TPA: choice-of-anchor B family protein, partial [Woeseiaceae bacterium]|nr:choice-of-anchor B family protein [Woeseiaceae bacterium]
EAPREVGFVDGLNTTWRDIKVYQYYDEAAARWHAYAYVTTDGASDGLFVIDLGGLPHSIARVGYASDFSAAHNIFAAHTDYATGLSLTGATPGLIVAGSNNGGGGYRAYSLTDPAAPDFVAMPAGSAGDYMHDAASILIRDARKDTQCVNAGEYCELLFDFNESTVDVWDVTGGATPVRLSRTPYANASYTHSGWPSEDGQYLFVHDELDEQGLGLNTTLRVFSLADLAAPVQVGEWQGPTRAIDHNGFVRGNRYYMSNYSRGLTVLDISAPAAPVTAGFLDTYPFSDSSNFTGAWGVYPYLPSGVLAVSDINTGLYIIADQTLAAAAGTLSFTAGSFAGQEGGPLAVSVQRTGGTAGAVTVAIDVLPATAGSDDVLAAARTLTWADGESGTRSLSFDVAADGAVEGLERLLVNLTAPTGGATLSPAATASVYISEAGTPAQVGFDRAEAEVAERGFGTAVLVLRRTGSAVGAASVDWAVSGGTATAGADYAGATSGTVDWPAGDATPRWLEFPLVDDGVIEDDETFDVSLSGAAGAGLAPAATARVTIMDGAGSNSAPVAVAGGNLNVAAGAAVTLNGSASNDPDGDTLEYAWQQTLGPAVTLSGATTATATFTAPTVTSDTLLAFELTVTDPRGLSDAASANVTVRSAGESGGSGGGAFGLFSLLVLAGAALRRRLDTARMPGQRL